MMTIINIMTMTMMEFRAVTRVIRQFPACPLRPMPAATLDNDEEDYGDDDNDYSDFGIDNDGDYDDAQRDD